MTSQDVVRNIAFIRCESTRDERPCGGCKQATYDRISKHEYIDEELIEDTAIAIANNHGDYIIRRITPLEFDFAFRLLEDIIPTFLFKVREAEVRQKLTNIKSEIEAAHNRGECGDGCLHCAKKVRDAKI